MLLSFHLLIFFPEYLKNLSLQSFLKQNPWGVRTQQENIFLYELSPAKWSGYGAVTRMWVPGYRGSEFCWNLLSGSEFTSWGPLSGIPSSYNTSTHSPLGCRLLSPFSTQTHISHSYTRSPLHSPQRGSVCDSKEKPGVQTHLLVCASSPPWIRHCVS